MQERIKIAGTDLETGKVKGTMWMFRYFNDVPILLDEIDRLRKLKR